MEDKTLSSAESLQLIDSMINRARNRFSENGHLYLVWGWTVFVIALSQFFVISFKLHQQPQLLWMLTFAPWLYMMVYLNRQKKAETVRTYTEEITSYVWLVFVVMMFLNGFIVGKSGFIQLIMPLALVLYGMPTAISGIVLRFRPLVLGGTACGLLGVASLYVSYAQQHLLLAAAVLVAWIVPGYLLRQRYNASNKK
ncbi:MAG: hypothetical protein MUF62_06850 [Chitinophagaceae bacterium]|jgi:hypothetical protein|nr:hypothetical protein [Chitinophagaceae bacterium]